MAELTEFVEEQSIIDETEGEDDAGEDDAMKRFLSTFQGGHIPDSVEDFTAQEQLIPSSLISVVRKALEGIHPGQMHELNVQAEESFLDLKSPVSLAWPSEPDSVEGYNYDEIRKKLFGLSAEQDISVETGLDESGLSFIEEASHDIIVEEDELSESTPHTRRRLPSPYELEDPLDEFLNRYPVGLHGIFRALVRQVQYGDSFSEYLGEGYLDDRRVEEPPIDIAQAIRDLSDSDSISCEQVESSSDIPFKGFRPCMFSPHSDQKEPSVPCDILLDLRRGRPEKDCREIIYKGLHLKPVVPDHFSYRGYNIPDPPLSMRWFKAMMALIPKCWNIDKAIKSAITVALEFIEELDPPLRPKSDKTKALWAFTVLDYLKHEQCIEEMLNVYYKRYRTSVLRDKLFDKVFMYALLFRLTKRNLKRSMKFFKEFPLDQLFPLLNFMNKHKNRVAMLLPASLLYSFDYIKKRFSLDQDFIKEFFNGLFKEMEREKMKKASILFNHNWIYNRGVFKHFTVQKPKTPLERISKTKTWKARPVPKYHRKCLRRVKKSSKLDVEDNQDTLNDVSSIVDTELAPEGSRSEKAVDYCIMKDFSEETMYGEGDYEEDAHKFDEEKLKEQNIDEEKLEEQNIDEEKLKEEILNKFGIVKKLKEKPRSSHLIGFDSYFSTPSYKRKPKKKTQKKKGKIEQEKKEESDYGDEIEEIGTIKNQKDFIAKFMLKKRIDEKEAEKKLKQERIETRLREIRAKNKLPPVVQTNATVLRDAKILAKEKEEQIQRIEELVSASQSFLDYEAILEKYRQMREQEEILEIERKHLEGLLSREEAIIAKQNLIIENAKKKRQADEEKKRLEEKLEELRQEELLNAQMIVEETREILTKIKDKQHDILLEKRKLAQERARQKEMNSKRIFQKKKQELEKKIELVRQIKAFQLIQKENQELQKQKLSNLYSMSSDELKAKIEKFKQMLRKDLEERQNNVQDKKMERKALLDAAKGFVKEMRKCKKNIRKEQIPVKTDKNQVVESSKKILDLKTKFDQARVQRIKNLELIKNPKKFESPQKESDPPSGIKHPEPKVKRSPKNLKLNIFSKKSSTFSIGEASKEEAFYDVGTSTSFSEY